MPACGECGKEPPGAEFAFCPFCGAPTARVADEQRKTVTVMFADLVGSTELGARLDPEVLRSVMQSYWTTARSAIERHGGTVAKFIGDAAVGVFGVPAAREDDAARALRAACDLVADVEELSLDIERRTGAPIGIRVGVNTGPVVVDLSTADVGLMVGDVANVGARLEQAAPPGQIYVGRTTHELARDAAEFEELPPLTVKGKTDPLEAYRLLSVRAQKDVRRRRRFSGSLVGRRRQLQQAQFAYESAVEERSCALLSIIGDGGVGKSRLVDEFLDGIRSEATILFGRALPYGEGMTYWPLAQALRSLDEDGEPTWRRRTDGVQHGDAIAMGLETMAGLADTSDAQQMAWAFRRYLELLAIERPVVLVLDDVQWADEAVIAIVEAIADLSRGAPILMICMARPQLLEQRPQWGGGRLASTTIVLRPLGEEDSQALLEELIGSDASPQVRSRIVAAADGNPLFLEEVTAALADQGLLRAAGDGWELVGDLENLEIPATVSALLAARLDRLPRDARRALDAASVIGQVFYPDALAKAVDGDLDPLLEQLVRADLIRPVESDALRCDTYSFTHLSVQAAAYEALPFAQRAELHSYIAAWLDQQGEDGYIDDLAVHHIERSAHFRRLLGTLDDAFSEAAATRLLRNAQRTLLTASSQTTLAKVELALPFAPVSSPIWAELTWEKAGLLLDLGLTEQASNAADELDSGAIAMGSEVFEWRAWLIRSWAFFHGHTDPQEVRRRAPEAISRLASLGDVDGLQMARLLDGVVTQAVTGDMTRALDMGSLMLADLQYTSTPRTWFAVLAFVMDNYSPGPRPLAEELAALDAVQGALAGKGWTDQALLSAALRQSEIRCLARKGATAEAREQIRDTLSLFEELGEFQGHMVARWLLINVAWLTDELAEAARELAAGTDLLRERGEIGHLSSWLALLALTLAVDRRDAEAEEALREARASLHEDDLHAVILAEQAEGVLLANRGDGHGASSKFTASRDRIAGTGYNETRLQVLISESHAWQRLDDRERARRCAEEARDLAEWLGWVPAIEQAVRRQAASA